MQDSSDNNNNNKTKYMVKASACWNHLAGKMRQWLPKSLADNAHHQAADSRGTVEPKLAAAGSSRDLRAIKYRRMIHGQRSRLFVLYLILSILIRMAVSRLKSCSKACWALAWGFLPAMCGIL